MVRWFKVRWMPVPFYRWVSVDSSHPWPPLERCRSLHSFFAYPGNLQVVTLKTISTEQCQQWIANVDDTQVCTLTRFGQGACAGWDNFIYYVSKKLILFSTFRDSGGPLECKGILTGIVSFGTYVCAAGFPDVFVKVSEFYDWIMSNTDLSAMESTADLHSLISGIPAAFQDTIEYWTT